MFPFDRLQVNRGPFFERIGNNQISVRLESKPAPSYSVEMSTDPLLAMNIRFAAKRITEQFLNDFSNQSYVINIVSNPAIQGCEYDKVIKAIIAIPSGDIGDKLTFSIPEITAFSEIGEITIRIDRNFFDKNFCEVMRSFRFIGL